MNRSVNESEFVILGFYYFIYLCSTGVSDLIVLLRRLIMAKVVFVSNFYCEDCFDWGCFFFNSRICVCECPVGVNCSCKTLASANAFCMYINVYFVFVCVCVCVHIGIHARTPMYIKPYTHYVV